MEGINSQQGHMLQMGQIRSKLKGPIKLTTRRSTDLKNNFRGAQKSDGWVLRRGGGKKYKQVNVPPLF